MLGTAMSAMAEEVPVPYGLQAELLFMIAGHDRNLPARAGAQVLTLVVAKPGDEAAHAVAQFKAAASGKATVGGLPHVVEVAPYSSATALAQACRSKSVSILYLAPGFTGAEATAIAKALEGESVLSVSAAPGLVKNGIVLGFDLVAGRPKLLVDLNQAAKQKVAFGSDVLSLMAASK
jgi:hypothetical protein